MKSKAGFIVVALMAFVVFSGVYASAAEPVKIGIVDIKRCIDESKGGRMRKEELRAKTEQMDERLKALEVEARAITNEVKAQQLLLTETLKAEKERRFMEIRTEAQNIQKEKQRVSDDLTKLVLRDIQEIVLKIAGEGGYSLILTDGGPWLLYFQTSLDVTDEVIAALDEKQP
jgi:outer membrane protein